MEGLFKFNKEDGGPASCLSSHCLHKSIVPLQNVFNHLFKEGSSQPISCSFAGVE